MVEVLTVLSHRYARIGDRSYAIGRQVIIRSLAFSVGVAWFKGGLMPMCVAACGPDYYWDARISHGPYTSTSHSML